MSEMRILTEEGDLKLQWSKGSDEEVKAAKETFKKYTKKGWKAYSVSRTGRKGSPIEDFDEGAEKIILMPPIMGG